MALLLTFAAVTAALFALFWAGGLLFQAYLYSQPADRLPVRAAAGAAVLAAFLSFWTYANTRADPPDRFGTFFEFTKESVREGTDLDAVRRLNSKGPDGAWQEQTVSYKRPPGRRGVEFVEAANPGRKLVLQSPTFMTVALVVADPKAGDKPRFEAELDKTGTTYRAPDGDARVFREVGGSRYVTAAAPGVIRAPSPAGVLGALVLNAAQFAAWFLVLWLVVRFHPGHAAGLAAVAGLATMLVVMPLLFNSNRP